MAISGCEFEAASQTGQIAELNTAGSARRRTRGNCLQLCISRTLTGACASSFSVSIVAASIVLALLCAFTRVTCGLLYENLQDDGRRTAEPHVPRRHLQHAVHGAIVLPNDSIEQHWQVYGPAAACKLECSTSE